MPLSKLELNKFLTVTNYAIANLTHAANLAISNIMGDGDLTTKIPGELGEYISDAGRNVDKMRKLSE